MSEYRVEQKHEKESLDTKHYDEVSAKVRKYIVGGAAVFIPELCEALKKDWYPRLSYEEITKTDYLRNEIKHQVREDWATEKSEDGIGWADAYIMRLWPDWLVDPRTEGQNLEMWQAFRQFMRRAESKKEDLQNVSTVLPAAPIIRKEDPESLGGHKEKPQTPEELYNGIMDAIGKLWVYLGNYDDLPGPDTDLESKVLVPSDKHRLRLLKGLDVEDRAVMLGQISRMNTLFVHSLKQAKNVLAQEPRAVK